MTTPFELAAQAALGPLYAVHGRAVTYTRGSRECEVTAQRVARALVVEDSDGVQSRGMEVEFTFRATDDDFDSVMVAPERGDTITEADGSVHDYASTEAKYLTETGEWVVPTQRLDP